MMSFAPTTCVWLIGLVFTGDRLECCAWGVQDAWESHHAVRSFCQVRGCGCSFRPGAYRCGSFMFCFRRSTVSNGISLDLVPLRCLTGQSFYDETVVYVCLHVSRRNEQCLV